MVDRDISRLLLIVGARSATDVALFLATSVVAYELGGATAVGVVGAVRVLPSMVTAGSAALVADRVRRPLVIAGVNASFVVVSLALALGVFLDLGLVYLVLVQGIGSLVSGLIKPSMQALLPQLVGEPRKLLPANSAWGLVDAIGGVTGPAAATGLLFVVGPEGVLVALSVVYAATAALALSIRTPFQPPTHRHHRRSFLQGLRRRRQPVHAPGRAGALHRVPDPAPAERPGHRLRHPLRPRRRDQRRLRLRHPPGRARRRRLRRARPPPW